MNILVVLRRSVSRLQTHHDLPPLDLSTGIVSRGRFPGRVSGQAFLAGFQELLAPSVVDNDIYAISATQFSGAVFAPKTLQNNTDLHFGGIPTSGLSTDTSDGPLCAVSIVFWFTHHRFLFWITMSQNRLLFNLSQSVQLALTGYSLTTNVLRLIEIICHLKVLLDHLGRGLPHQ